MALGPKRKRKKNEVNSKRIKRLLSSTKLPEKLWFLFEETETLDPEILEEVQAILRHLLTQKVNILDP